MLQSATSSCEHQQIDTPDDIWWNENMLVDLFDRIHMGEKFHDLYESQRLKFPSVRWKPPIFKPEHRPGKGKYKEFDCAQKKKYEDVKKNVVTGDVWSENVTRNFAYSSISWSDRTSYRGAKINNTHPTLKEYSSDSCACGHEIGGHDDRGFCIVCKKFCDIGGGAE
jgi:hypothetical protein